MKIVRKRKLTCSEVIEHQHAGIDQNHESKGTYKNRVGTGTLSLLSTGQFFTKFEIFFTFHGLRINQSYSHVNRAA